MAINCDIDFRLYCPALCAVIQMFVCCETVLLQYVDVDVLACIL